ncbi:MAG TPA: hypothetical protein ENN68_01070 [Methanomicrobia archaeon]|nr:hypothetical protein [Methanomicrobia archaeon]
MYYLADKIRFMLHGAPQLSALMVGGWMDGRYRNVFGVSSGPPDRAVIGREIQATEKPFGLCTLSS